MPLSTSQFIILYVNGKPLGAVPGLAIVQQNDATILLLFCDEEWNAIGLVACSSLSDAKSRAEREFSGLSTKWVSAKVSEQEAPRYIEERSDGRRCSFCGKSPEAVQQVFAASAARICDGCVRDFYDTLNTTRPDDLGENAQVVAEFLPTANRWRL